MFGHSLFVLAIREGAEGTGLTVIVILPHDPFPHEPPSPLAKYVVVTVGETFICVPVPTFVPPQLPLYHCQLVALFKVPEAMLNEVLKVPQLAVELALNVGVVGGVADKTVIVILPQLPLPQELPSPLA